jgi:hypothetical protein
LYDRKETGKRPAQARADSQQPLSLQFVGQGWLATQGPSDPALRQSD